MARSDRSISRIACVRNRVPKGGRRPRLLSKSKEPHGGHRHRRQGNTVCTSQQRFTKRRGHGPLLSRVTTGAARRRKKRCRRMHAPSMRSLLQRQRARMARGRDRSTLRGLSNCSASRQGGQTRRPRRGPMIRRRGQGGPLVPESSSTTTSRHGSPRTYRCAPRDSRLSATLSLRSRQRPSSPLSSL
jgi:hypothetical protein